MPDYQKTMADELGLKLNDTKLVLMLHDKENYVVHYKNLQFYLNQRLKLGKVHRVLDGAVDPDEHRISEASQKRIQELLQTYEQLPVRENDGERVEAC